MDEVAIKTEDVVEGVPTTPEHELLLALADDGVKLAVPRLNDALARLVTLSTAMAGGAVGFLKDDVCTTWGRVAAAAFFFLALVAAVGGSIPYVGGRDRDLETLAAEFDQVTRWKRVALWLTSALLGLGSLSVVLGAAARAAG